jgi:EAL domain-containing protein (putative c-di-GMP-specific phosphodiesterase class I)
MRHAKQGLAQGFPTRIQLLIGFSVLVAIFVAGLAVGLGSLLRESIRDEALSGAEQTGRLFAELEVGREEYKGQELAPATPRDLNAVVAKSESLRVARVWNRDGRLAYSSDRSRPGRPTPDPGALSEAFRGNVESRAPSSSSMDRLLRIYVPIKLAGDRKPRSVLEAGFPYKPIQASIESRTKKMAFVLGLGALLFYLALLPTVLRGSKALAELYAARQVPLQRRLRRAMKDDELALVYQPKLDLQTRRVEGVEALLRWRLPDGSTVPPADFIALVEPTPVMEELTMHVFELAVRQSARWAEQDLNLDVAVNISPCNLREAELPSRLARLAAAHGRNPASFTLEVTESAMSQSPEHDLRTLTGLRACGFKLSIDDFGTGESSLSRIGEIDCREIKIDRCFVQSLDSHGDPALIAGIIDLVHAMGARVVAEGVESDLAARHLTELGCDALQGFHLARPMAPDKLTQWLGDSSPGFLGLIGGTRENEAAALV